MSYKEIKVIKSTDDGIYVANTITTVTEQIANELIGGGYAEECNRASAGNKGAESDSKIDATGKAKATSKKGA